MYLEVEEMIKCVLNVEFSKGNFWNYNCNNCKKKTFVFSLKYVFVPVSFDLAYALPKINNDYHVRSYNFFVFISWNIVDVNRMCLNVVENEIP